MAKSKGLEFEHVFYPLAPATTAGRAKRNLPAGSVFRPPRIRTRIGSRKVLEELRRLFYVAVPAPAPHFYRDEKRRPAGTFAVYLGSPGSDELEPETIFLDGETRTGFVRAALWYRSKKPVPSRQKRIHGPDLLENFCDERRR